MRIIYLHSAATGQVLNRSHFKNTVLERAAVNAEKEGDRYCENEICFIAIRNQPVTRERVYKLEYD